MCLDEARILFLRASTCFRELTMSCPAPERFNATLDELASSSQRVLAVVQEITGKSREECIDTAMEIIQSEASGREFLRQHKRMLAS